MKPNATEMALRRRYRAIFFLARGHDKLITNRTNYVGTGVTGTDMAQICEDMFGRSYAFEHVGI